MSSADSFSVSMSEKGLPGVGFRIAVSKSVIEALAASTEEFFGMGTWVWNHSMVSAMQSDRVSMMNDR